MGSEMWAAVVLVFAIGAGVAVYVFSLHLEEEGRSTDGSAVRRWIRRPRGAPGASMPGTASAIGFGDVSTEEAFTADPLYRSEAAGDSFAIEGHRLREHIPLRTRIVGLIGLVILVPLGAGLIGLAIYWVGHLARMVFERWSGAA